MAEVHFKKNAKISISDAAFKWAEKYTIKEFGFGWVEYEDGRIEYFDPVEW